MKRWKKREEGQEESLASEKVYIGDRGLVVEGFKFRVKERYGGMCRIGEARFWDW